MPSPDEILAQVADVTSLVLGIPAEDVVGTARFTELGTDSLTIVEIGEEIGRRFDKRLTDDQIDRLDTVQSAVTAVLEAPAAPQAAVPVVGAPTAEEPPAAAPRAANPVPTPAASAAAAPAARPAAAPSRPSERNLSADDLSLLPQSEESRRRAGGFMFWLAVTGVLVGGLLGFGLSAMVSATGIDDVALPPLPGSSSTPTPTEETPTPTPTPRQTDEAMPEPTLVAESDRVSPGERFVLSGAFPELGEGARLQVQVREQGTGWDDFPITTETRQDGQFKTELYTSRTGEREFRLLDEKSGDTTPTVKVTIG